MNKSKLLTILLIAALSLGLLAGCSGGSKEGGSVTLTYWTWGEQDIPGWDKWLKTEITKYKETHSDIKFNIVAQNTDTLTGSFEAAARTKSGPDIATLWATMPVLTQAWNGYVAPISDYVSKDESQHWLSTSENTYDGKLWSMPIYLIGAPLVYNKDLFTKAGLDPNNTPKTWDEFIKVCAQLKEHNITPIGMGNKNGYAGAWLYSLLAVQYLDSVNDLKQAVLGKQDIKDPKFTGWYSKLDELAKSGYFNDNISSQDLNQGWTLFPQGQAAMTWTSDGQYAQWLQKMGGEEHIGVMRTPIVGNGTIASKAYDVTQASTAFITSWSKHKKEAAEFLTFLHTKESLTDFYTITGGGFPADDRFDTSLIKEPSLKQLWEWDTTLEAISLENYLPPVVDQNADIAGGQLITSKSGSVEDAVKLWVTSLEQWRSQHPDELKNYTSWTK